jgi:hypothetical protein
MVLSCSVPHTGAGTRKSEREEDTMFKNIRTNATLAVLIVLACAATAAAQAPAGVPAGPQQWVANVVNMQGGGTARLIVHADSFSPPEEVLNLAAILRDKGQGAVVEAMLKMSGRGYVRIGDSLGYEVPVIRYIPTPTGYRIVVIADRPIQLFELWRSTRSLDYPVGMIVLDVNKEGTSTGQLLPTIKASFDKDGKLELENLGTQPLRVLNVRSEATK